MTTSSENLLDVCRWFHVRSVPRPAPDEQDPVAALRVLLTAGIRAAHATLTAAPEALAGDPSSALAVVWQRSPGTRQVQLLLGGRPVLPAASYGSPGRVGLQSLVHPPGAMGVGIDSQDVLGSLSCYPAWIRCRGSIDALRVQSEQHKGQKQAIFEDYVVHLRRPFAWVMVAQPVSAAELQKELNDLSAAITLLGKKENSEEHRLDLQRKQGRYLELTQARVGGTWRVHTLVGGLTPQDTRVAASVLCSAFGDDTLPYALIPDGDVTSLDVALDSQRCSSHEKASPFVATAEYLATLTRPPVRELPGIRLTSRHQFDITPEHNEGTISIGEVLDDTFTGCGTLMITPETLNRHAFVCGATGSGKSQSVRSLLTVLAGLPRPIPWLVIEPAKAEYARITGRLGPSGEVVVIHPGKVDEPPPSLNPLEPEPDFPLQSHLDLVRSLLLAAFDPVEPLPQILSRSLTACYTESGWDLVTSAPHPRHKPKLRVDDANVPIVLPYPTLSHLQATARRVVEDVGYGREVSENIRGFIDVRIGSLREGTPGRFFEGGHPLDLEKLLARNVVLELEDITNDQDKAFLIGVVLIRIVEYLRVDAARKASDPDWPGLGLRHLLVVEEAHTLLRRAAHGTAAAAVDLFASMLAEIRAYGEGVLVVEQIPDKIVSDVVKNSALKVMHRLPGSDDRAYVGATMNLSEEQAQVVVAMPPGQAAVSTDGMDRPLLVQMPYAEHLETNQNHENRLAPLKGTRSPTCGTECQLRKCTLWDINESKHQSQDPAVIVWVEAVTAALITGVLTPGPNEFVINRFSGSSQRKTQCTLSHAVDRAVLARQDLRKSVDPVDFSRHLSAVLHGQLRGKPLIYNDAERWMAGAYRWASFRKALTTARDNPDQDRNSPHQATSEFIQRGFILHGNNLMEQLNELDSHPQLTVAQCDVSGGDQNISGLRQAVRNLTGGVNQAALISALRRVCQGGVRPEKLAILLGQLTPSSTGASSPLQTDARPKYATGTATPTDA